MNTRKNPKRFVREGALYYADNGRVICARCAGMSATFTGRDISGQRIKRVDLRCAQVMAEYMGTARCEEGCTVLATINGSDGWPQGSTAPTRGGQ